MTMCWTKDRAISVSALAKWFYSKRIAGYPQRLLGGICMNICMNIGGEGVVTFYYFVVELPSNIVTLGS